jgi:hypothetical protein
LRRNLFSGPVIGLENTRIDEFWSALTASSSTRNFSLAIILVCHEEFKGLGKLPAWVYPLGLSFPFFPHSSYDAQLLAVPSSSSKLYRGNECSILDLTCIPKPDSKGVLDTVSQIGGGVNETAGGRIYFQIQRLLDRSSHMPAATGLNSSASQPASQQMTDLRSQSPQRSKKGYKITAKCKPSPASALQLEFYSLNSKFAIIATGEELGKADPGSWDLGCGARRMLTYEYIYEPLIDGSLRAAGHRLSDIRSWSHTLQPPTTSGHQIVYELCLASPVHGKPNARSCWPSEVSMSQNIPRLL